MVHIHKREIRPLAATWIGLEIIILSESDKDKYHMTSLICWVYNELIYKTEVDS